LKTACELGFLHAMTMLSIFQSGCAVLSGLGIAWVTQIIINYWDKRKKVEETKLSLYISWMPFLADCYARVFEPSPAAPNKNEFLKKKMEILGILQIMGPQSAKSAFCNFTDLAEKKFNNDPAFDGRKFHESFGQLNYVFCCEIHGEKPKQ
jgi:hypothetical protein